ncbi:MAG: U32 family peptidase [SAR324 cluster bacterium]|nr:U32 family peptidase [SAR324 cluster bacterium]
MNWVLNLGKVEHLESVIRIPINEVVVQTCSFSLFGKITDDDLRDTFSLLCSHSKRITLQWDLLCRDEEIERLAVLFSAYADVIRSVRFVDPGVGAYLKIHFPEHLLQFLMWDGHQNRTGILNWIQVFQPNLQRVIISNQMSRQTLQKLRDETKIPIEIKVLGRIQLFYSARSILHNNLPHSLLEPSEINAVSTDRPSQFFVVDETSQGTVIFNDQDLFLLDDLNEIQKMGIDVFGLELYTTEQYQQLEDNFEKPYWIVELKKSWKKPLTIGFFVKNQTDALHAHLTNAYLRDEKINQVGSVLDSRKNVHTLLHLQKNLTLPQQVVFFTPEGKSVRYEINKLYDLKGDVYQDMVSEGFYLLPWIKYIVPASILKLVNSNQEANY